MQEKIIIAAVARNNVIGNGNTIPWHISEDFKRFKRLTTGFPIIMGSKTWMSLPKRPLLDRENIVISRNPDFKADGATVFSSLEKAIEHCKEAKKIFFIGGASVYEQAMKFSDVMEITRLENKFEGDAFFPKIDNNEWQIVGHPESYEDPKYGKYSFIRYLKVVK